MDQIQFANKIAQLAINHYNKLPKTGKPNINKEWTIMAAIIQENTQTNNFVVVSLGTGSKCIGENKLCPNGTILNDSHAEIICRRAFLRYLYEQIDCCLNQNENNKQSIFVIDNIRNKCHLRDEYHFHLFCSQVPCGDAAIHPKQLDENLAGNCFNNLQAGDSSSNDKKRKLSSSLAHDIHRTGAKCLKTEQRQDPHESGVNYHTIGVVRTKPGRGHPTLSVSCSDKLARWIHVGIQGALLTLLITKPIYIKNIIFPKNIAFSHEALMRALVHRFQIHDSYENQLKFPFQIHIPNLIQSDVVDFPQKQNDYELCPSSIIWCNVRERSLEVAVDGRKQGVTKKNIDSEISQVLICKRQLLKTLLNIVNKYRIVTNNNNNSNINEFSYGQLKESCTEYYQAWNFIRNEKFKCWTCKDKKFLQFTILN